MAIIKIEELCSIGYELFVDEESYLKELSSDEELSASGGMVTSFNLPYSHILCTEYNIPEIVTLVPRPVTIVS
jgi:hypothetical protein